MAKFDVDKARSAGYNDQEIQQFMAQNNLVPKFSMGGFAGNVGKSAFKFGKDIIFAPINLIGLGKGLATGETKLGDVGKSIGQSYKDRYGGWDELARSLYFDPISVAADASIVAGVGGAGVKALGLSDDLARGLSSVSKATDPLRAAGKATSTLTKPVRNLFAKKDVSGFLDDASSALAKKSLRPSPSQQRDFLDVTGMDIGDYARDMNLQGGGAIASKKIEPIINSIRSKYNALARSGKGIDPTSFIDELRKSADDILSKDFSAEAQQVAKNIRARADLMETNSINYMIQNKTNTIPIDILTETKASAFGKVPKGTMQDPTKMHGGKVAGGVGISQLETLAPGTQKLGKTQQAALAFRDIAKQQSGLGKGTQLINLMKPSGSGAVLGGVLGGFPGAVAGAGVNMLVNSPGFSSGASKVLHKASNITKNVSLPSMGKVGQVGRGAYEVAKYSRPLTQKSQVVTPKTQPKVEQGQQPTYKPTITPTRPPVKSNMPTAESFYEEIRKKRGY
jgi:hypothetical protein